MQYIYTTTERSSINLMSLFCVYIENLETKREGIKDRERQGEYRFGEGVEEEGRQSGDSKHGPVRPS